MMSSRLATPLASKSLRAKRASAQRTLREPNTGLLNEEPRHSCCGFSFPSTARKKGSERSEWFLFPLFCGIYTAHEYISKGVSVSFEREHRVDVFLGGYHKSVGPELVRCRASGRGKDTC